MSEKADFKIENILLTLKKHINQTFEVLYFSSEIENFLLENENVANTLFFERLFPGLKRPIMDFFFLMMGSKNKVLTPFLTNNHQFQFVQIEGCVIAQEDKSYLINILISDKNPASEINLAWLVNFSKQEFYSYCKNFSAANLKEISYLKCFLMERFNFLDETSLENFLNEEKDGKFEIFSKQLYLNKEKLANGYYLISLTFSKTTEGDLTIVDLESYDQVIRQYSGSIYYEHQAGKKDVKWSGATLQLLGYTQNEMNQITMLDWLELIHPEDRNSIVIGFESDKNLDGALEVVYRIKHRNGDYIYVHDVAKPFFKSETGKQIILGTIKDVSALKKVENDLLENKSKLNELTGVVPGMVYMMKYHPDDTHHFVFVSEGARQLFEADPELIRQSEFNLIKHIHPEDLNQVLEADKYAYKNDVKFESQFRIITPSGKVKWIYGASSRLPQYDKESVWAGFFIDISYTKKKEEEANYNFQRYRALFEDSPLAILQFDREGRILGANKNFLKMMKLREEAEILSLNLDSELSGMPIHQIYKDSIEKGMAFYEGPFTSLINQIPLFIRVTSTAIDKGESFQAIIEEVSEQEFFQNILNKVADLSTRLRGQEFFEHLCELLTYRFNIKYCYIGQYSIDKQAIEILAMAKDGRNQEPFTYELKNSPSDEMLKDPESNYKIIPNNVGNYYPDDSIIQQYNIQSYGGISLLNAAHEKVGILAFLDEKPLENQQNFGKILQILGDRIGAELQRQKYEQELLRTNKLQETILNGSDYAIFSLDEEMRVNLINHKTLEFFNINDKDKLLDVGLISGGNTRSLKELILNSSNQKNKADYFLLPMKGGKDRELKLSFISIQEPQNDNPTYVVFADDITDRTAAEKKLQESEQLYRSIAENFPKGTVDVLDKNLRYIYTEGKEYQVLGLNPKDLIGSFHLLKYEAEVAHEAKDHLADVLNGKTVMYEVTYGGQHYLKSGVPLYNAAGKIDRILLVTQNITDSKKSEKEREKLIKDLKSHNEELQRFAYIVSHNLRAPIVNISALLNLYNEENPADIENEEVIEHLKISTDLLSSTLMDLIEVVSIRKQKLPKVESLSFQHVLHNVERSLHQQITESKAIITTDFEDVVEINYVYSHLENFFLNFLTNAIKYKHPERDPVIHISAYKMGEYHVVSFSDNGIGLDLERYGDRLFGLYQRFHSHVDGKGLGLYLVREQIRAYDGDLTVESAVGEGTTFKAYLKNMRYSPSLEVNEPANQD
ncbi:MAG TPA: PAS domain S-box protein [Anditalea sp.]|nr:PAS domain S-box protein [Anditalea sp.]